MRPGGRVALGLGLVLLAAAGCTQGTPPPPDVLADGSQARPLRRMLEGVDGATVATRVRVLPAGKVRPGSRAARCVGRPAGIVVVRVGASGQSITYVDSERHEARGCDATASISGGSRWCGRAYARLRARRLADPRLGLTCRVDDEPVAFAWVQPAAGASYVVVAQPGYSEVYRAAGGLPVRVATAEVDLGDASAVFAISEHAPDGRLLRTYDLEAHVSG